MTKKRKTNQIRNFYLALVREYKENKASFLLYVTLRTVVSVIAVMLFLNGSYESALLCVMTLALFLVPAFVQTTFKVELPTVLEIISLVFIFAAEILGELGEYYMKVPLWDTMLHTATGFLAAAVGLSLIDLLNRSEKFDFKLSPIFVALVSFSFSMTIGVMWEFFEFSADMLLKTDMQKDTMVNYISSVALHPSGKNVPVLIENIRDVAVNGSPLGVGGYLDIGLIDTMKDLFVNFIGAVVFSVFGYFYSKYNGVGKSAGVVKGLKIEKK